LLGKEAVGVARNDLIITNEMGKSELKREKDNGSNPFKDNGDCWKGGCGERRISCDHAAIQESQARSLSESGREGSDEQNENEMQAEGKREMRVGERRIVKGKIDICLFSDDQGTVLSDNSMFFVKQKNS
jgi:hypothetical protein